METTTMKKKSNCEICEKCFLTNRSKNQHLAIAHSGKVKTFACNVCNKIFVQGNYLYRKNGLLIQDKSNPDTMKILLEHSFTKFLQARLSNNKVVFNVNRFWNEANIITRPRSELMMKLSKFVCMKFGWIIYYICHDSQGLWLSCRHIFYFVSYISRSLRYPNQHAWSKAILL